MARPRTEQTDSLSAYPNISDAAKILDVAASTLSRRKDLVTEPRGERDRVLTAGEVMKLAAVYRKRSLNDVAQALIELAEQRTRQGLPQVESEIEAFFEDRIVSDERREAFLETARQVLPGSLYRKVEKAMSEATDIELPEAIIGYQPPPES